MAKWYMPYVAVVGAEEWFVGGLGMAYGAFIAGLSMGMDLYMA